MSDFTRYIVPNGGGIADHPSGLLYRREEVDPVVDALRARIRQLEQGVAVKPLEWSEELPPAGVGNIPYDHVKAESIFGLYSIEWKSWKDHDDKAVFCDGEYITSKYNLTEAKAAAQADYEARIRSALTPAPVTEPEPMHEDAPAAIVGEIGNQIHNLGCEFQNDEELSERLADLACQTWKAAKLFSSETPAPVTKGFYSGGMWIQITDDGTCETPTPSPVTDEAPCIHMTDEMARNCPTCNPHPHMPASVTVGNEFERGRIAGWDEAASFLETLTAMDPETGEAYQIDPDEFVSSALFGVRAIAEKLRATYTERDTDVSPRRVD